LNMRGERGELNDLGKKLGFYFIGKIEVSE
jgi:hypothetical protein